MNKGEVSKWGFLPENNFGHFSEIVIFGPKRPDLTQNWPFGPFGQMLAFLTFQASRWKRYGLRHT